MWQWAVPSTMKDSIQDEADEVTEVLGVESAARCPAHVVANSQRNFSDLRVAVVAANKTKTIWLMSPHINRFSSDEHEEVLPQSHIQGNGSEKFGKGLAYSYCRVHQLDSAHIHAPGRPPHNAKHTEQRLVMRDCVNCSTELNPGVQAWRVRLTSAVAL